MAGGVADARTEGAAPGARVPCQALSLQPERRARAQHVRLREDQRDHQRHRRRAENRADVHRCADARDRRRRHHEHHVRQRSGTDARDRRPQGAGRPAAGDSLSVPAGRARDHVCRRRRRDRGLVGPGVAAQPPPVSRRVAGRREPRDRHPPGPVGAAGGHHVDDSDGRRPGQRTAAGAQSLTARSDRSTEVRVRRNRGDRGDKISRRALRSRRFFLGLPNRAGQPRLNLARLTAHGRPPV